MRFDLRIGIDYSGAQTPTARLSGLQVYFETTGLPEQVMTPAAPESKSWNWTRQAITVADFMERPKSDGVSLNRNP